MALKPCRECKRKVSTEASTCPKCGVPYPTKKATEKIEPKLNYRFGDVKITNDTYQEINVPRKKNIPGSGKKANSQSSRGERSWYESFKRGFFSDREYKDGDLPQIFWLVFVIGNVILNGIAYVIKADWLLTLFIVIWIIYNIGAVLLVYVTADEYKRVSISRGQSYGWATAAKVFPIIYILSTIGNQL